MNIRNILRSAYRAYLKAILAKDKMLAWSVITETLVHPLPTERVYLDIIGPAHRRLRELRLAKKISAADEHIATIISEFIISRLYLVLVKTPPHSPKVMVTCLPSGAQQLGARVMADFLEADGWNVRFMGGGVPMGGIVETARKFRPRAIFLSVAVRKHLREARRLVSRIKKCLPQTAIFLGGDFPFLSQRIYAKVCKEMGLLVDGIPADAIDGVIQARNYLQNGRHVDAA